MLSCADTYYYWELVFSYNVHCWMTTSFNLLHMYKKPYPSEKIPYFLWHASPWRQCCHGYHFKTPVHLSATNGKMTCCLVQSQVHHTDGDNVLCGSNFLQISLLFEHLIVNHHCILITVKLNQYTRTDLSCTIVFSSCYSFYMIFTYSHKTNLQYIHNEVCT